MVMVVDFATRLRDVREAKGMTREELANKANISLSALYFYEKGEKNPSGQVVAALAKVLEVSADYLLGLVDDPQGHLKGEVELPRFDKPQKTVPLLGKVSAGQGIPAEEDIIGFIPLEPGENADFALKVKGHSMHPLLQDGDIVFVRKQPVARNGQLAVVRINGDEGVIKKFYKDRSGVTLRSENPEYPPIYIKKDKWDNECEIIGVVVSYKRKFPNL